MGILPIPRVRNDHTHLAKTPTWVSRKTAPHKETHMDYVETTENYSTLGELQSDIAFILNRFREIGNMDVEVNINLLDLTITIIKPKESDDI